MKKNLLKVLSVALIALVAMTVVAAADTTATIDGSYSSGTVTITVSGVGTTDEVSLIVVAADQDLGEIATSEDPGSIIKFIEQKTAASGTVTFTFTSNTEDIDVYSGYSSMGVSDTVLLKEFRSSSSGGDSEGGEDVTPTAPTVDTTKSWLSTSNFTFEGFQRIFVKLTEGNGAWMPAHNDANSSIYYSTEREGYDGLIKSTAADLTAALAELTWSNVAPTADQTIVKYGDMTGEGTINILDSAKVKKLIKNLSLNIYGTHKEFLTADTTGDGFINVLDSAQLKKHIKATTLESAYTFPIITK